MSLNLVPAHKFTYPIYFYDSLCFFYGNMRGTFWIMDDFGMAVSSVVEFEIENSGVH